MTPRVVRAARRRRLKARYRQRLRMNLKPPAGRLLELPRLVPIAEAGR